MTNGLTKFLEERQREIFSKMTNLYGRFKTSDGESFWEGYIKCMEDIHNFLENEEGNGTMTEQEIISFLKDNRNRGIAFGFMPEEVKAWCGFHSPTTAFRMFNGVWSEPWIIRSFNTSNIYCLANGYEPGPEFKGHYEEFEIDDEGYFVDGLIYTEKYKWFSWERFLLMHDEKYNDFGGWLYNDKVWSTKVLMDTAACQLSGSAAKEDRTVVPVRPTKIRFWRYAE